MIKIFFNLVLIFIASSAYGQLNFEDPLNQQRELVNESEILLYWTEMGNGNQTVHTNMFDLDTGAMNILNLNEEFLRSSEVDSSGLFKGGAYGIGGSDICVGNFFDPNVWGQGVVNSWRSQLNGNARGAFEISTSPGIGNGSGNLEYRGGNVYATDADLSNIGGIPQIKCVAGNFCPDIGQDSSLAEDEFIVAFQAADGRVHINLYEPGLDCSNPNLCRPTASQLDSIHGPEFWANYGPSSFIMDVVAGDIDLDGYDEIILTMIRPGVELFAYVYQVDVGNNLTLKYPGQRIINPYQEDVCCTAGNCSEDGSIDRIFLKSVSGNLTDKHPGDEIAVVAFFKEAGSGGGGTGFFNVNLLALRENQAETGLHFDICDFDSAMNTTVQTMHTISDYNSSDEIVRIDLAAGDLDGDGSDGFREMEIVLAINNQVRVFNVQDLNSTDNAMKVIKTTQFNTGVNATVTDPGIYAQGFLDVGNVNGINGDLGNDFTDEIVIATNEVHFNSIDGNYDEQAFNLKIFSFPVGAGDLARDISTPPTSIQLTNIHPISEVQDLRQYQVKLVDYDGMGFKLGKPVIKSYPDVLHPLVIINAPPTHFDVFANDTIDLMNLYEAGNQAPPSGGATAKTIYTEDNSMTLSFTSEINSDWSKSENVGVGFDAFGLKLGASMTKTYSGKFRNVNNSSTLTQVTSSVTALFDDEILAYKVDFDVYEYPVYKCDGNVNPFTYLLVVIPKETAESYVGATNFTHNYRMPHEHGNLFSYYRNLDEIPEGPRSHAFTQRSITNDYSGTTYEYNLIGVDETDLTREESTSTSIEANGEFSAGALSIGGTVSGSYSSESLSTKQSSIVTDISFSINFGNPETGLNPFNYNSTPLLYWSNDGTLVLDYLIEISNDQLFQTYYNKIDPGFILPDLLTPEKEITVLSNEADRYKTRDIIVYPAAQPNQDVTISSLVQNFGFLSTTQPVPVCFYYSDTLNGEDLILIGCDTIDVNIAGKETAFDTEVASIQWTIPDSMDSADEVKIISIIDPANILIDEVHDYPVGNRFSNNIGWKCLFNADCGSISNVAVLYEVGACSGLESVLTLDDTPIQSGTYQALDKIVLSGTVPTGHVVLLKAPNGAEFVSNFNADLGSDVEVQLIDCEN